MSHINDLIGVLRGLRLVVEAGVKVQQEASQVICHNSTLKNVLQNLPTNTLTPKPSSELAKDMLERAIVVAQGFRQYAVMNIPNFKTDLEKVEMDPQMKEEIDELNKEFNKTFEILKKSEIAASSVQFVAPLENIRPLEVAKVEMAPVAEIPRPVVPSIAGPPRPVEINVTKPAASASTSNKPVAKKKIKVSVSIITS